MTENIKIPELHLFLFDGAAVGAGDAETGAGDEGSANKAKGVNDADPLAADETSDENESDSFTTTSDEEKEEAEYQEYLRRFKSRDEERIKRTLNARMRGHNAMKGELDELRPIAEYMRQVYGARNNSELFERLQQDKRLISEQAAKLGMSDDAYLQYMKYKSKADAADRAQRVRDVEEKMTKLFSDEQALMEKYPDFDPEEYRDNKEFDSMLRAGVPMEHAYRVLNLDKLEGEARRQGAAEAAEAMRQRRNRPAENASKRSAAAKYGKDVANMTKAQREELERRALRGETITL